jgi:hypothetical protein
MQRCIYIQVEPWRQKFSKLAVSFSYSTLVSLMLWYGAVYRCIFLNADTPYFLTYTWIDDGLLNGNDDIGMHFW